MKAWAIRILVLLVYSIVLLLVIGWLTPARVGLAALWAGPVLTIATLWIRPLVERIFQRVARPDSDSRRTGLAEAAVQLLVSLAVAGVVWWLIVVFTPVRVGGWFWGWILPPVLLAIGWAVFDALGPGLTRRLTPSGGDRR